MLALLLSQWLSIPSSQQQRGDSGKGKRKRKRKRKRKKIWETQWSKRQPSRRIPKIIWSCLCRCNCASSQGAGLECLPYSQGYLGFLELEPEAGFQNHVSTEKKLSIETWKGEGREKIMISSGLSKVAPEHELYLRAVLALWHKTRFPHLPTSHSLNEWISPISQEHFYGVSTGFSDKICLFMKYGNPNMTALTVTRISRG